MAEVKLSNIPSMDVNGLIEQLSSMYCSVINAGIAIKTLPSVMLWGAPALVKARL